MSEEVRSMKYYMDQCKKLSDEDILKLAAIGYLWTERIGIGIIKALGKSDLSDVMNRGIKNE